MAKVKICGITNLEDALLACELGADALGFIFYSKSPRFVSPKAAAEIIAALPPFVTTVGVVVNESDGALRELCKTVPLHLLQLHGDESPAFCANVPLPYIKVFRIGRSFEMNQFAEHDAVALLLDTLAENHYGGTGRTFDWTLANKAARFGRIILSGGLNPENVQEALRCVRPYAVDCASGVEASPGKKDPRKLAAFFNEIHHYRNHEQSSATT